MEDSPMYAADIRALTMRADSADWTAEALAVENRVLLGAINALTARAERAEATVLEAGKELGYTRQMFHETEEIVVKLTRRVKELTAELAEQERAKLLLIQETHRWSAAVKTLEAERIAKPDQEETCIFSGCKNVQVHDGACECYVNGRAHGEEANA